MICSDFKAQALTLWHHVHHKLFAVLSLQVEVIGVDEFAVELAPVGSFVLKGDVGDEDGSVLQVFGLLAAGPVEAVGKTIIHDDASSVTETIQLGHSDKSVNWE